MSKHKKNKKVAVREVDLTTAPPVQDTSGGRYMVQVPIGVGKMNDGPPDVFQQEYVRFSLEADNIEDARLKVTSALSALVGNVEE